MDRVPQNSNVKGRFTEKFQTQKRMSFGMENVDTFQVVGAQAHVPKEAWEFSLHTS